MTQIIFLPHEEICPEGAVVETEPGTACGTRSPSRHVGREAGSLIIDDQEHFAGPGGGYCDCEVNTLVGMGEHVPNQGVDHR